jgi:hypothetical protein
MALPTASPERKVLEKIMSECPKVIDLLNRVVKLKTIQGWSYESLRDKLNEHLPPKRKLRLYSGRQQVKRWLSFHCKSWVEPKGEIVLAFQEVLARFPLVNENNKNN